MTRKEKLVARLLSHPRDFTFEEAEALLTCLGFRRSNKSRTSGSRVSFIHPTGTKLALHRPHPAGALKPYQVHQLIDVLAEKGLI